jgi:hypothetical protein
MGKIDIERNNCDQGYWKLPDGQQVPLDKMAEYYISETEGQSISLDDLESFEYKFNYTDPAANGKHNVPGKVELVYKRKS